MPTRQNRWISASIIAGDRQTIRALKDLPDYAPYNPEYSVVALLALEATALAAEDEMNRARISYEAARDRYATASLALHTNVLGAKDAVVGQFGSDSHAVSAIGLTRKSARKTPVRRAPRSS